MLFAMMLLPFIKRCHARLSCRADILRAAAALPARDADASKAAAACAYMLLRDVDERAAER